MLPFFLAKTGPLSDRQSLNFFTFGKANAFLSLYT